MDLFFLFHRVAFFLQRPGGRPPRRALPTPEASLSRTFASLLRLFVFFTQGTAFSDHSAISTISSESRVLKLVEKRPGGACLLYEERLQVHDVTGSYTKDSQGDFASFHGGAVCSA